MHGIEILTSKEVIAEEKFNWKWFVAMNILTLAICTIAGVLLAYNSSETQNFLVVFVYLAIFCIFWGLFLGWIMGSLNAIPILFTSEYKIALLDESVISKLEEKYEIIDRDGKLLTIREKIRSCNSYGK